MLNPEAPKKMPTTISRHVAVLRSLSNRLSPLPLTARRAGRATGSSGLFGLSGLSCLCGSTHESDWTTPVTHVTIIMMP
jgi:hypothetical protein